MPGVPPDCNLNLPTPKRANRGLCAPSRPGMMRPANQRHPATMNLSDEQKSAVAGWLEAGANLSEVQKRLREEFQLSLTYLDTRLLVDDLKLTLKDSEPEPTPAAEPAPSTTEPPAPGDEPPYPEDDFAPPAPPAGGGKVNVTIDQIMKPGMMISGNVTFSDGETAAWYLDQMGRLGLDPKTIGYRPAERDVLAFQVELQRLARTQGY